MMRLALTIAVTLILAPMSGAYAHHHHHHHHHGYCEENGSPCEGCVASPAPNCSAPGPTCSAPGEGQGSDSDQLTAEEMKRFEEISKSMKPEDKSKMLENLKTMDHAGREEIFGMFPKGAANGTGDNPNVPPPPADEPEEPMTADETKRFDELTKGWPDKAKDEQLKLLKPLSKADRASIFDDMKKTQDTKPATPQTPPPAK
jgi:hypothetical protein